MAMGEVGSGQEWLYLPGPGARAQNYAPPPLQVSKSIIPPPFHRITSVTQVKVI